MSLEQNVFQRVVAGWEALGGRASDLTLVPPLIAYDDGVVKGTIIVGDYAVNEELLQAKLVHVRKSVETLRMDAGDSLASSRFNA